MIGDAFVWFSGLAGLIEQCKSVIAILMCKIDLNAFACEVLERIVIMLAVDCLIEYSIFRLVRVIDVDRFLINLRLFYFGVIKAVHRPYRLTCIIL